MRIEGMDATATKANKSTESHAVVKDLPTVDIKQRKTVDVIGPEYAQSEMDVSEKAFINAVNKANKAISGANRRFEFSVHEATKEIMVKVINDETGDVIREIPNQKILDMVAKMWEMAGIMVDERG
jgi:flagellar protein FlaG